MKRGRKRRKKRYEEGKRGVDEKWREDIKRWYEEEYEGRRSESERAQFSTNLRIYSNASAAV